MKSIFLVVGLIIGFGISLLYRKKRENSLLPYERILQKIPQGLMVFDQNLQCVFQNDAVLKCLPMTLNNQDSLGSIRQFIRQSQLQKQTIKLGSHDYFVEKWQEEGFTVLAFELSEQKKIQQVGRDFVANASHELRTPITIIKGFTETLKDLPQISDVMLHDFTDKILRSCQRMDNLVKNLLLLADLDHAKRINKRPSDLLCLIDSVSYTLLSLHPEILIETLSSHEEITLSFDPDMLEQALINLLENAVKYSPKPAEITIVVEKSSCQVIVRIIDKGVGIPEEHLPHIFQRFYRVNQDRSRKLGGAGLGLSIVQAIIDKHDGKITAYSKEGEGTTFEIIFETKEAIETILS